MLYTLFSAIYGAQKLQNTFTIFCLFLFLSICSKIILYQVLVAEWLAYQTTNAKVAGLEFSCDSQMFACSVLCQSLQWALKVWCTDKTSQDKTSQDKTSQGTKRPKGQNVPRDKTSQGKKNSTFQFPIFQKQILSAFF